MLPRPHRLKTASFAALRGTGRSYQGELATLKVVRAAPSDPTRVAFVVSAKVAKTAVARNQLKRRGRAAVGEVVDRLAPGYLAAFYFKGPAASADYATVAAELTLLLKQGRLL